MTLLPSLRPSRSRGVYPRDSQRKRPFRRCGSSGLTWAARLPIALHVVPTARSSPTKLSPPASSEGRVDKLLSDSSWIDSSEAGDPPGFWIGWKASFGGTPVESPPSIPKPARSSSPRSPTSRQRRRPVRTPMRQRSADRRDSLSARPFPERRHPAGRRAAGNDPRHQRPARRRREDRLRHHAGFRRRPADRQPEPAAAVRPGDQEAEAAVQPVVEIDERLAADGSVLVAPNATRLSAAARRPRAARASSRSRSACCTPTPTRPTKSSSNRSPARSASPRSASPAASRR